MDLNADLGESTEQWESGADRALLEVVTSANVCCGAYAGDAVGEDEVGDTVGRPVG